MTSFKLAGRNGADWSFLSKATTIQLSEQRSYKKVRCGYSNPEAIILSWFFFLVLIVLLFGCYAYEVLNVWLLTASVCIVTLATICAWLGFQYQRTLELSGNGYRETAQVLSWILWQEHYPLVSLQHFQVNEGTENQPVTIQVCLTNGEQISAWTSWDSTASTEEVTQIVGRLNDLLIELKTLVGQRHPRGTSEPDA